MITAKEIKLINEEVAKYPQKKAACIEALKIVQDHHGWITDEAVEEIGTLLNMSMAEVENVATFYNLIFRKPIGKHVILFCCSVSCWIQGYEKPLEAIFQKLGVGFGETTRDNKFTLLPIQCLGNCHRAPTMMIDEDTYHNIHSDQLDEIFEKYK